MQKIKEMRNINIYIPLTKVDNEEKINIIPIRENKSIKIKNIINDINIRFEEEKTEIINSNLKNKNFKISINILGGFYQLSDEQKVQLGEFLSDLKELNKKNVSTNISLITNFEIPFEVYLESKNLYNEFITKYNFDEITFELYSLNDDVLNLNNLKYTKSEIVDSILELNKRKIKISNSTHHFSLIDKIFNDKHVLKINVLMYTGVYKQDTELEKEMLKELANLPINKIFITPSVILKNNKLSQMFIKNSEEFNLLSQSEYVQHIVNLMQYYMKNKIGFNQLIRKEELKTRQEKNKNLKLSKELKGSLKNNYLNKNVSLENFLFNDIINSHVKDNYIAGVILNDLTEEILKVLWKEKIIDSINDLEFKRKKANIYIDLNKNNIQKLDIDLESIKNLYEIDLEIKDLNEMEIKELEEITTIFNKEYKKVLRNKKIKSVNNKNSNKNSSEKENSINKFNDKKVYYKNYIIIKPNILDLLRNEIVIVDINN